MRFEICMLSTTWISNFFSCAKERERERENSEIQTIRKSDDERSERHMYGKLTVHLYIYISCIASSLCIMSVTNKIYKTW